MSTNTIIRTGNLNEDELKEAASGGSFALLPKGWYETTIKGVEVVNFGNDSKWDGYKALNVQLRVADTEATGKGRTFFLRVPLFQRFLPTQKNPQGAVASMYFDFFLALGFTKDQVALGEVEIDAVSLGGRPIGMFLVQKEPDAYKLESYNEVSRVRAAKAGFSNAGSALSDAFAAAATAATNQSPWGDSVLQAAADGAGESF